MAVILFIGTKCHLDRALASPWPHFELSQKNIVHLITRAKVNLLPSSRYANYKRCTLDSRSLRQQHRGVMSLLKTPVARHTSWWKVDYTSTDMLDLFALVSAMVLMSIIMPVKKEVSHSPPGISYGGAHQISKPWLPPWLPIYTSWSSWFPNSRVSIGKKRGRGERGKDIRDTCLWESEPLKTDGHGTWTGKQDVFIFPDQVSGQHLCAGLTHDLWKWQSFIWASRRRSGANRYVCNTHRPQS